jgi:regulator of sigma E protease
VSWLLAFAGFAVLIILHELGHFAAAKAVGMRVERFSLFFPPLLARVRRGETEYAVGAIPLGGYVKITGMNPAEDIPPAVAHRAYFRQPVWKRIFVIAAGPFVNVVIAFLIFAGLAWANGVTEPPARVGSVQAGTPAEGKLRPGDAILAVDGRAVTGDTLQDQQRQIIDRIAAHRCAGSPVEGCRAAESVRLLVERGGAERTLDIRPFYDAEAKRTRLGYVPVGTHRDVGPARSSEIAVDRMWFVTRGTVETIAGVFDAEKREQISGVVGSYEVTRQYFEFSFSDALVVLGVISLSLAVINLFPFLPLDGGHIFWALAEKVRGRAIPFSVMERAGFVGFVLVIALFTIGLSNDIGRLTGDGFQVPR